MPFKLIVFRKIQTVIGNIKGKAPSRHFDYLVYFLPSDNLVCLFGMARGKKD